MYRVLIANRGEIALRIMRTLREFGHETVAIYSTADQESLHVQFADHAVCIGGPQLSESYLNIQNILNAAEAYNVDFIHPGYGLLSENPHFVKKIEKLGLGFVGPSSDVLFRAGNKLKMKTIAKSLEISTLPFSTHNQESLNQIKSEAETIGFPVLLKATNGGGGKGIRIAENPSDIDSAYDTIVNEIEVNFGDGEIYIEKFLKKAKHIEVQAAMDYDGNFFHFGERECTIQRNNQKIIEESLPALSKSFPIEAMRHATKKLFETLKYTGIGTVEFLIDNENNYYFLEINPRLQVEHPVTEMLTGIDIVKLQLDIESRKTSDYFQNQLVFNGHAIECRILVKPPHTNKFTGLIKNLSLPGGPDVRIDTHIYSGYHVPPFYDPLLGKLIVKAKTRPQAIKKMLVALEQFIIDGIDTNIEELYQILHDQSFIDGTYQTALLQGQLNLSGVIYHE